MQPYSLNKELHLFERCSHTQSYHDPIIMSLSIWIMQPYSLNKELHLFERCSHTQSYHDPIIMHINYGASLSHYLSESWSRTDLKYRPILIVCRNNVAALSHHLSEICSRTHYLLNDAAVLSHVTIVSVRYTLIVSYHWLRYTLIVYQNGVWGGYD